MAAGAERAQVVGAVTAAVPQRDHVVDGVMARMRAAGAAGPAAVLVTIKAAPARGAPGGATPEHGAAAAPGTAGDEQAAVEAHSRHEEPLSLALPLGVPARYHMGYDIATSHKRRGLPWYHHGWYPHPNR